MEDKDTEKWIDRLFKEIDFIRTDVADIKKIVVPDLLVVKSKVALHRKMLVGLYATILGTVAWFFRSGIK